MRPFFPTSARLLLRIALAAGVASCADTSPPVAPTPNDGAPPPVLTEPVTLGLPLRIDVPTYDSSGQATHPDVLYFPDGWRGWEYWMAFTPFPHGDNTHENPSIVVSHDGLTWSVPAGLSEPLVPSLGIDAYNSDPDLRYNAKSDALVLVYREVRAGENVLKRMVSHDGITWTAPAEMVRAPNHQLVSPAIVSRPRRRLLWAVDAPGGCAETQTRVIARRWIGTRDVSDSAPGYWSSAVATDLAQPGFIIWHIDVVWVEPLQQYWAVYPARPEGRPSCVSGNDLFLAFSRDGLHWTTFDQPALTVGITPWLSATLYRSSMVFDSVRRGFRVWLSGRGNAGWTLGYVEVPLPDPFIRRDTLSVSTSRMPHRNLLHRSNAGRGFGATARRTPPVK